MVAATKEKKKIQKGKNDKLYNTENMLPISEIRWNTIVLKDGWLRAILKIYWLNLDLKNYEEQQAIIQQYKRFLNWQDFPLQILIRNTYLDLTNYIEYLKDKTSTLDNDVLEMQSSQYMWFLEDINSKQWLIYVKEFYIVVPYYQLEADMSMRKPWWRKFLDALDKSETPEKVVQRYRTFIKNRKHLDTRCNIVAEWLKSMWIVVERLDLPQIISLLFKVNNPNSHRAQAESIDY